MLMRLRKEIPEACLSDLTLDELGADELAPAAALAAEAHLGGCVRCQGRQAELRGQAEAYLNQFPQLRLDPRPTPLRRAAASRSSYWGAAGALAVAAGVALLFGGLPDRARDEGAQTTRLKGGSRLSFFVKRGTEVLPGFDGQAVRAGDRLRFAVSTAAPQHLAVLSRDSRGVASIYHPQSGTSEALGMVREAPLPTAVELDDAPGEELLYAVFCPEPFTVEPLRAALARHATLPPLPGCSVDRLKLLKEASP
jgi:hypothetical protein